MIEMASQEIVDEIKISMQKLNRYRQLISKLEQSGSMLGASFNAANGSITEAIVSK